jgi:phenylacetate-CoA ligase
MGYTSRDKALILMGGHVAHNHDFQYFKGEILSFIINAMKKQIVINPYSTDAGVTNSIISHLINSDVKLVRGYSQFLYNLCQQMKERGVSCHIPAITTTAEPLMHQHRELFKDVLGAESYDQYGCGEVGGVAFECEKHEGMHITEERVIVEQNESNDLILTDLDNYAMPFVRYHNADQAVVKNEKCSCGREHRLIEKVMGRTCDYVIGLNGEYLHWAYFWHLVFDSGIAKNRDLKKFQIVQESKDTIVFKYIASSLNSMEIKSMTDNIQSRLGKIEVVFQQEIEIPNTSSGKYRPVINKLIS